ncbi:MAG: FAD-dependent oxidoreductase [Desulfurococcales archaeon]|nr:FAD-dependent oxidoreductase [Desulfurococcales archaeon]
MKFLRCKPDAIPPSTGKKIAIIGAGPAGLGAAGILRCKGHDVVVYDQNPEPGGMILFGIPITRIPKEPVRKGIKELANAGVKFVLNTKVDMVGDLGLMDQVIDPKEKIHLEDIIKEYDATIIATGTWKTREMGTEGERENADWVYPAVEWIVAVHMAEYGYKSWDTVPPLEGRILVVGGGLTAADSVLIPLTYPKIKDNVKEVVLSYRRSKEYAPMGAREIDNLILHGAKYWELTLPVQFRREGDKKIVKFVRMELVETPGAKRPKPKPIPGSEFEEEFDYVLKAVGVLPTPPVKDDCCGIKVNEDGTIAVDEKFMTTREGVFAAGDVKHGPSLIGPALKSGVEVAKHVEEYLSK